VPAPIDFRFSFRKVAVASRERSYLIGGRDDADRKNLSVSFVFRWANAWASRSFRGDAVDLCVVREPSLSVIILDVNGYVHRWTAEGITSEAIDEGDDGPDTIGPMRAIQVIGGSPFVVGMGRTVYRGSESGGWLRLDEGVRVEEIDSDEGDDNDREEEVEGFNSIDGFDQNDVYAGGWNGAIWHFDGRRWSATETLTNVAINAVVCVPDGRVYAAGQLGTLIEGRAGRWRVLSTEESGPDYWDAVWFQDRLYLVEGNGLHVVEGDRVEKVEVEIVSRGNMSPLTFSALSAYDGVMWAIGPKTAIYTSDGRNWSETTYA
jgi:hypothetical protein